MKFTLDTTEKIITIEGNFTKVEMTQLFDILDIENIEEYTIQTKSPDFWYQTNTYNPDMQLYSTNNTFDNNLKVVYKNIVDSI